MATKFCEISTVNLSYVVKSTVEISQNFVAFFQPMTAQICSQISRAVLSLVGRISKRLVLSFYDGAMVRRKVPDFTQFFYRELVSWNSSNSFVQRDRRRRALLQHQNFDFLFYLGRSGCFILESKHIIVKVVQS